MNIWRRPYQSLLIIGLLIFGTGIMAGCIESNEGNDTRTFTDQTGNQLKVQGIPERIVTLTPALTEIVVELGAGNLLVGGDSVSAGEFSDLSMETVSTWEGLDSEKLIAADPDLVIMDKTLDITEVNYNTIIGLSIPVYRAYPLDLDLVMDLIENIGIVLDMEEKAANIKDEMKGRMDLVMDNVSKISTENRPEVLYVTYYDGTSDPWVGSSSTFSGNLIEMAGGKNSIDHSAGVVVQVSIETIIDNDPDVIITSQSTTWPTPSRSTILDEDTWKDISAVENGRVIDIDGDLIDRTGPHLIEGLEAIYTALYPEGT